MYLKRISYMNIAVALLFSAAMLSSCSSSKKFARDPIYDAGKSHGGHRPELSYKNDRNLDPKSRKLLDEARKWLGTRYVYGGHSRSGTDCSGFVMEVYDRAASIKLPRSTTKQRDFCKSIKRSDLDVGDLVFFTSRKGRGKVSHVGMYIGDGKMIHASSSKGVIVSDLDEKYYVTNYHSSGRVTKFRKESSKKMTPEKKQTTPTDRKTPDRIKEVKLEDLDDVLNQKIDSIYSNMLD